MLLVGDCWRRLLKVILFILITAEIRLLDGRAMRPLLRRHGPPRSAAVTDPLVGTASPAPGRWLTPCAGSTTAETPLYSAASSSVDASSLGTDDVDDLTSQHGRRRLLRRLARQMSRLADRVDRLKQRYVSFVFVL